MLARRSPRWRCVRREQAGGGGTAAARAAASGGDARLRGRRPIRSCSTARSSRTASRSASLDQIFEGLVTLKAGHDRGRARRWRRAGSLDDGRTVDVQPARGRQVPRRHAVQRRGGLLQLRPLVQLHGSVPEPERATLLLADGLRRLRRRTRARARAASTRAARRSDENTVVVNLTKPSASFLGALVAVERSRSRARRR